MYVFPKRASLQEVITEIVSMNVHRRDMTKRNLKTKMHLFYEKSVSQEIFPKVVSMEIIKNDVKI